MIYSLLSFGFILSISEEEIDRLSLLHLSSSSMEELLLVDTHDNIIKEPIISLKTIFEKKREIERKCLFIYFK